MAAKGNGPFGTLLSIVFTAVVAPVTVSLIIQNVNLGEGRTLLQEPKRTANDNPPSLDARSQIIVQGIGWTPEEALQDALRNALRTTLTNLVDPTVWARQGQALCKAILRDDAGLIVSHKDLRITAECQQGKQFYSRTI